MSTGPPDIHAMRVFDHLYHRIWPLPRGPDQGSDPRMYHGESNPHRRHSARARPCFWRFRTSSSTPASGRPAGHSKPVFYPGRAQDRAAGVVGSSLDSPLEGGGFEPSVPVEDSTFSRPPGNRRLRNRPGSQNRVLTITRAGFTVRRAGLASNAGRPIHVLDQIL